MKKKRFQLGSAAVLCAVLLAGCGESTAVLMKNAAGGISTYAVTESAAVMEDAAAEETVPEYPAEETAPDISSTQATARKLIRNVDLEVETQAFDELMANLTDEVVQLGGYVESCSTSRYSAYDGWNGSIEARVPCEHLDDFLAEVSENSNVICRNERVEDVTLRYVDLDTHKKTLITEQERLLALLEKAETVEEVIAIESRLSEVRYQIESMEEQLRTIDNQVSYSTVYISIQEVALLTPSADKSVWQEIAEGFGNNVYRIWDGIASGIVEFLIALPYFVMWGVFLIAAVFLLRLLRKVRRKKKEKRNAKQQLESTYEVIPPKEEKGDK